MSDQKVKYSFSVIKHRGTVNTATTVDGFKVERKERLYFDGHGLVQCASYDNHFLYIDPSKKIGRYSPMCTCGFPGGIVGSLAYRNDASPTTKHESTIPGQMVVCLIHAQTGKHADGST